TEDEDFKQKFSQLNKAILALLKIASPHELKKVLLEKIDETHNLFEKKNWKNLNYQIVLMQKYAQRIDFRGRSEVLVGKMGKLLINARERIGRSSLSDSEKKISISKLDSIDIEITML